MVRFFVVLSSLLFTRSQSSYSVHVKHLPDNLRMGAATSSYQIEGAWNEDGKGENIWDRFTHTHPEKINDLSNGDIACDSYHKTVEDIALIKDLGLDFYRFSLSWSRILPSGFPNKVNEAGIAYYNNLIDKLIANNIEPLITIFHWDLPQPLQDLGGFTNPEIVNWIKEYARVVFSVFGDRVKTWITFNEPKQICKRGYETGEFAPGVSSWGIGVYLCAHNIHRAHANIYHLYDKEFRSTQKGRIGLVNECIWGEPATNSSADHEAADRFKQFYFGLYTNPVFGKHGDYPEVVKQAVAHRSKLEGYPTSRLPRFTPEEVKLIKGSYDFFGLNHYSTVYVKDKVAEPIGSPSQDKDMQVTVYQDDSWLTGSNPEFKLVPWGFRKILNFVKNSYDSPNILVTENGFPDANEFNDVDRIRFFNESLDALLKAIYYDNVQVEAYTAWSIMDNFEWTSGYQVRFGFYHVNYTDPKRTRTPKASVAFYKNLLRTRSL